MDEQQSGRIDELIRRQRAGDADAGRELLAVSYERLRRRAGQMFVGEVRLRRWEETDDLHHEAWLRLRQALDEVRLTDARHYYALASEKIRQTLIDLARRYFGPQGAGRRLSGPPDEDTDEGGGAWEPSCSTFDPQRLARWTTVHEYIGRLPQEERRLWDLLYYQELSQSETAKLLDIHRDTLRKRWRESRHRLGKVLQLDGEGP